MPRQVLILRGEDEGIAGVAKANKLTVAHGKPSSVPFDKALVVKAGTAIPWELIGNGFFFVNRWDAACPVRSYSEQAEKLGNDNERKITKALTLDLRIPVYACELLFVRDSEDGRGLLAAWEEEQERGKDERLAFLRAVARVKPRLCTLPAEWMGIYRKRREPYIRASVREARKTGQMPVGLVRVEVGPGRFVLARPENVERVKEDYARRESRRG